MSNPREDLLQPSLSVDQPPLAAPYSTGATLFTGLFGGPFAAFGIVGLNALRLKRLARDIPVLIAALAAVIAVIWWLLQNPISDSRALPRLYSRIGGVAVVGAGYLLHRQQQRNADLANLQRPNGWVAGVAFVIAGSVLYGVFVYLAL